MDKLQAGVLRKAGVEIGKGRDSGDGRKAILFLALEGRLKLRGGGIVELRGMSAMRLREWHKSAWRGCG